jgi:hypothetical protein
MNLTGDHVIEFILVQNAKADLPIVSVTDVGIVILPLSPLQRRNA